MCSNAGIIGSLVKLGKFEILECKLIQIDNLAAKESRILEEGLCAHDSICIRLGETLIDVVKQVYSSIGNNGNVQGLFNFANDVPVALTDPIFVLFFCSTMNCQQFASSLFYSFGEFNGFLF
jgi:hypothetical protein